jgi:hypothetical protein
MEKTVKFRLQNETKGALRYAEELPNGKLAQQPNDVGAIIGTLYLRKTAFNGNQASYPDRIAVTIATTG